MRTLICCLALGAISLPRAAQAQIDTARLLDCIAQRETGSGWNGEPGPAGELSRYQISPDVWKQHSKAPFAEARMEPVARAIALQHIAWLTRHLEAAGQPVTVERLATCWHLGLSHRKASSAYGEQVSNLYYDGLKAAAVKLPRIIFADARLPEPASSL